VAPRAARRRSASAAALMAAGVLAGALLAAPRGAAAAEGRAAFLVGNAAYAASPLANPRNDARALASSLKELGFRVTLAEDADERAMDRLLDEVRRGLPAGGIGVFYYAGHAVQHRGRNYLLPVDFRLGEPAELPKAALPVDRLLDAMHDAGVRVAVVVLDACRDNPFGSPDDALGPGLAAVERSAGETMVAYATAAGEVARDGAGPNSPYTAALVSALERPGLTLEAVFREVRARVREATEGRQLPWVSGSLETALVLRPGPAASGGGAAPPEPEAETAGLGASVEVLPAGGVTLASTHWRTIEPSQDRADFRTFLDLYAGTPLAPFAEQRLASLAGEVRALPLPSPRESAALPDGEGGVAGLATDCDLAASDDQDPARLVEPVRWGLLNTRLALRVCAIDLARDPENPRLQFLLGRALDAANRFAEAEHFYREAAGRGHGAAMVNLGYMSRTGRGRPVDEAEATRLYRRAALLGNPRARTNLGQQYLNGRGVPRSEAEGVHWIRLAADNGWANAITALGDLFDRGRGVPEDPAQAAAHYLRAAQLGSGDAMNNLGRLHETGRGVPRDAALAVGWYERAIAAGNRYAPARLGRLYAAGPAGGVADDPARALALFNLAADRGFLDAHADIGRLLEAGRGAPKDPARAYYHYLLAGLGGNGKGAREAERLEAALPPAAVEALRREARAWRERNPI
jgi:uncharacterized protein